MVGADGGVMHFAWTHDHEGMGADFVLGALHQIRARAVQKIEQLAGVMGMVAKLGRVGPGGMFKLIFYIQ